MGLNGCIGCISVRYLCVVFMWGVYHLCSNLCACCICSHDCQQGQMWLLPFRDVCLSLRGLLLWKHCLEPRTPGKVLTLPPTRALVCLPFPAVNTRPDGSKLTNSFCLSIPPLQLLYSSEEIRRERLCNNFRQVCCSQFLIRLSFQCNGQARTSVFVVCNTAHLTAKVQIIFPLNWDEKRPTVLLFHQRCMGNAVSRIAHSGTTLFDGYLHNTISAE